MSEPRESFSTPEANPLDVRVRASTGATLLMAGLLKGNSATEMMRHAIGLYDYGAQLDDHGQELFNTATGTVIPHREELDPAEAKIRLCLNINQESAVVLADREVYEDITQDEIVDQAVLFLGRVIAANMREQELVPRFKIAPGSEQ